MASQAWKKAWLAKQAKPAFKQNPKSASSSQAKLWKKLALKKWQAQATKLASQAKPQAFFPFKNKVNFKHFRALFEPYNWPESSQCFMNTILGICLINATIWAKIYVVLTKEIANLTHFAGHFHVNQVTLWHKMHRYLFCINSIRNSHTHDQMQHFQLDNLNFFDKSNLQDRFRIEKL